MTKFEKLRGLANQRERLTETLNELTKFSYELTHRFAQKHHNYIF